MEGGDYAPAHFENTKRHNQTTTIVVAEAVSCKENGFRNSMSVFFSNVSGKDDCFDVTTYSRSFLLTQSMEDPGSNSKAPQCHTDQVISLAAILALADISAASRT